LTSLGIAASSGHGATAAAAEEIAEFSPKMMVAGHVAERINLAATSVFAVGLHSEASVRNSRNARLIIPMVPW